MLCLTRPAVEVEYLANIRTHREGKHTHTGVGLKETIRRPREFDEFLGQVEGIGFVSVFNLVLNEFTDLIQWVFRIDIVLPSKVFVYAGL